MPLILGNLLQQLYNTADSIIVGNFLGSNALAAVGSSGSPIYLLIGFSQGVAVGAGVVVSQYLGAKDKKETRIAVHTSLAIAVILGLILTVGGIAVSRSLLVWMNTPEEVLGDAVTYMKLYFGGVLFSVVYNMAAGILNAAGNSRRSVIYLACASITNSILDLVLIAGLKMGVAGAAIATDISQLVSCVLSLRFLMKVDADYKVEPFRHPARSADDLPHHPHRPSHRHPEHGHLFLERAGAVQRQQLRCRRHGRLCGLYGKSTASTSCPSPVSAWLQRPSWARTMAQATSNE
mgnify:CR=1 FL=1